MTRLAYIVASSPRTSGSACLRGHNTSSAPPSQANTRIPVLLAKSASRTCQIRRKGRQWMWPGRQTSTSIQASYRLSSPSRSTAPLSGTPTQAGVFRFYVEMREPQDDPQQLEANAEAVHAQDLCRARGRRLDAGSAPRRGRRPLPDGAVVLQAAALAGSILRESSPLRAATRRRPIATSRDWARIGSRSRRRTYEDVLELLARSSCTASATWHAEARCGNRPPLPGQVGSGRRRASAVDDLAWSPTTRHSPRSRQHPCGHTPRRVLTG